MADKTRNVVAVACTVIVTVIAVGGVLLSCGAVTGDIKENKDDIVVLQAADKEKGEHIVNLQMNYVKQQATADNTLNVLTSLNTKMESFQKVQSEQATIQAVNSVKLESLTKD